MNSEEVIKEKLEFLKLEYGQLKSHNDHLEELEWKVRQLSITLWLASISVGADRQRIVYCLAHSASLTFEPLEPPEHRLPFGGKSRQHIVYLSPICRGYLPRNSPQMVA
jgi:hypothetical protein